MCVVSTMQVLHPLSHSSEILQNKNGPMTRPVIQNHIPQKSSLLRTTKRNWIFFKRYWEQKLLLFLFLYAVHYFSPLLISLISVLLPPRPPTHVQPSSLFPQSGSHTLLPVSVCLILTFFPFSPGQQVTLEDQ